MMKNVARTVMLTAVAGGVALGASGIANAGVISGPMSYDACSSKIAVWNANGTTAQPGTTNEGPGDNFYTCQSAGNGQYQVFHTAR
ncbi:MAG: hypothetical protein GX542_12625 [Rhodococcus sp.]|nr:hypothetical protein [Rhodococcus sp. (in: high G+C Gram-positive bacteria)]